MSEERGAERDKGLTEAERETLDERVAGGWWGYYIHFEPTGVPEIDRLLSAVGLAGKMYHHTSDWNEDDADYGPIRKGESPVDFIQRAARDAATRVLPPAECSHGEPEGNCASCAACAACRGECGVCPYVTSPEVGAP